MNWIDGMTDFLCDRTQIRRGLELLFGYSKGFVEIRAIYQHEKRQPSRKFYENSPDVSKEIAHDVDNLVKHNGVNIYVGRSLRAREVGDASGIDFVSAITMDFDSALRPKDRPATDAEVNSVAASLQHAKLIGYAPHVIASGNGIQLWWPLSDAVDVRGRRKWWEQICKKLESSVEYFPNLLSVHTKQDPQFDLPRVVKLPGTWSFKGTETPDRRWRQAWITGYTDTDIPSSKILALGGPDLVQATAPSDLSVVGIPKRFWEEMQNDELLHDSYLGKRFDIADASPSGQDWSLCVRLKRKGFSASEALAILKTSQNVKARTRPDYCETTIRKVYE